MDSGRVGEVLKSVGMNRAVAETHPDTGKRLTGVTLPNWQESVRLCSSAASALPEIRLQNWDVAMCPDGPMLIEVNAAGDVDISQFVYRAGLRTVIP